MSRASFINKLIREREPGVIVYIPGKREGRSGANKNVTAWSDRWQPLFAGNLQISSSLQFEPTKPMR